MASWQGRCGLVVARAGGRGACESMPRRHVLVRDAGCSYAGVAHSPVVGYGSVLLWHTAIAAAGRPSARVVALASHACARRCGMLADPVPLTCGGVPSLWRWVVTHAAVETFDCSTVRP
jgi:hypothetical protein